MQETKILSNRQLVALYVATNQQTVIQNAFKSSRARLSLDGKTLLVLNDLENADLIFKY